MATATSNHLKLPVAPDQAGTTSTGTIPAYDGLDLHFVRYHPASSAGTHARPTLSVVFVHGFAEHVGRYSDAFPLFAARGIELICFDQRGFGNTADKAAGGFAKNYTNTTWPQQFKDVQKVIAAQRVWLNEKYPGSPEVPIYLVGHSMGGGISTALFTRDSESQEAAELADVRSTVKGVVASSPWLSLTQPPPGFITFLAPRLIRWIPTLKYPAGLKADALTSDKEAQAKWEKDPWIQNWVRAASAFGPLKGGEEIVSTKWHNWQRDTPLLIVHGEADMVTSHKASKTLVDNLKTLSGGAGSDGKVDAQYVGFPGGRHEMLFEAGDVKSDVSILSADVVPASADDHFERERKSG